MARPCKHIAEALPPMPRVVYFLAAVATTLAAGLAAGLAGFGQRTPPTRGPGAK